MARSFRYYGKKRGHRRVGSPWLGTVGEAALSAVLLLLGCAGVALLFFGFVVPEWRVNHEFIQTSCRVLETRIRGEPEAQPTENDLQRPAEHAVAFVPEIKIEFDAGSEGRISTWSRHDIHQTSFSRREDAQAVLDRFRAGERYPCWYDPADPYTVVLTRGGRWWIWLGFTVPLSLLVIGAGGLIHALVHWGHSAERRAAVTRRLAERERRFLAAGVPDRRYPTVPEGADITNSPGTKLKYRLPMATSPGWALFGILTFCVVWNGIVAVFAVMAVRSHFAADGKPDWLLTLFVLPFAAIGVWAIIALLRQLLMTTGIGPTLVEISDHPLRPGGRYRAFLSQSGWLKVVRLRVSLVCEESATYRQGTDSRTESCETRRSEIFCREGFEIRGGAPFEAEMDLSIPSDAMHSFVAAHNEIGWTLEVEGEAADWPKFRRAFPVVVRPAAGEHAP